MSKPFQVHRVEKPTEQRLREAAELFTELMKTNLGAISLAGGDISLMNFQALALLRAGVFSGEYYEATGEGGELIGYTLWMPPGQEMFSTEKQRALGFNEFMSKLSDEAANYYKTKAPLFGKYVAEFPAFVADLLGKTGKVDSWWMHMAMVKVTHQRRGVLRALVDLVHKKANDNGEYLATCTTNDSNIRVYTGLGFDYKGSTMISSPWGEWPIHVFKQDFTRSTT